jgi:hypothetical protein
MNAYLFYSVATNSEEAWCQDVMQTGNKVAYSNYLTTLVIVAINVLIRYSLTFLVLFERLETLTAEVISYSLKLFICQYINTALLTLFIYNNLSQISATTTILSLAVETPTGFNLGLFSGTHSDLDYAWYTAVGASLTFTMLFYTIGKEHFYFHFSPHH